MRSLTVVLAVASHDAGAVLCVTAGAQAADPPTVTVTAPDGAESWTVGGRHDVTWTLAEAVDVGSFDVWAWSPSTSWYQLNGLPVVAVPGETDYSLPWTVAEPPAGDYTIRVWYRDAAGAGIAMDDSDAPSRSPRRSSP